MLLARTLVSRHCSPSGIRFFATALPLLKSWRITSTRPPIMASSTDTPSSSPRKLRLLCLHGYTQSGPLFRAKTRALEKNLQKHFPAAPKAGSLPSYPGGVEFHYVTGPHKLTRADIPTFDSNVTSTSSTLGHGAAEDGKKEGSSTAKFDGGAEEEAYGWWVKSTSSKGWRSTSPGRSSPSSAPGKATNGSGGDERISYDGLDETMDYLASVMRAEGPFDGVLGFSQGGCLAIMLASILETGRSEVFAKLNRDGGRGMAYPAGLVAGDRQALQPLKFAICYSGFRAPEGQSYDAFCEGGLSTPTLHFIGSVDTVVEESRCLANVDACRGGKGKEDSRHQVVYHPGGHFVPASQKPVVGAVVEFIRQTVNEETDSGKKGKKEESVEDMDVPF